ncbi:MAG TPA: cupredoxin domain-containing protein [bacterium]|nr:cupredoxin domain-containing protein [bacterium]
MISLKLDARRLVLIATAAVVFAAAVAAVASATPQTVTVTIRHSRFLPANLIVRRGATVRFVITNLDPIDHEFLLGDEAAQNRHETGTEPAHGTVPGEVSVPPGTTAVTTYTFSRTGVVLLGCHAPGHYAYGMRGRVLVVY